MARRSRNLVTRSLDVRSLDVRSILTAAVAVAAGAWGISASAVPASAVTTGASGSLGAGGTAKGDISLTPGQEDVVTVDLVQGSTVTAKFASTFAATVDFSDPNGAPLDLGWGTGAKRTAKAWAVPATGTYAFRIRSAAGAQGTWVLSALAKWQKKVTLPGTSGTPISWGMPANAKVSGKVAAFPAKSWDPVVDSIVGPGGNLLPAPIAGAKGMAKLPPLTTGADGMCEMSVSGGTPGGEFRAALVLTVPRTKPVQVNLADGLTTISFANDGVKQLLADNCVACHTWAAGAATAKGHAKMALVRVKDGSMPQGGRPLSADQIGLLASWIGTGMKP